MPLHLNLGHAAVYLNAMPVSHLDGLWWEIDAKMKALGLMESRRAVRKLPELEYCDAPSGSLAGIVAWVRSLDESSSASDRDNLVVLHAIVSQRFALAKYAPKPPRTEE